MQLFQSGIGGQRRFSLTVFRWGKAEAAAETIGHVQPCRDALQYADVPHEPLVRHVLADVALSGTHRDRNARLAGTRMPPHKPEEFTHGTTGNSVLHVRPVPELTRHCQWFYPAP